MGVGVSLSFLSSQDPLRTMPALLCPVHSPLEADTVQPTWLPGLHPHQPGLCEQNVNWECPGLISGDQLLTAACQGLRELQARGHGRPTPIPLPVFPEPLSNVVVNGVLQGFYSFSTSTADTQPELPCHPAPLPPMP